jgi:hypothetical protein
LKNGASTNSQDGGKKTGVVATTKKLSQDDIALIKKDAYIE